MKSNETSKLAEESIRPIQGRIDNLVFWHFVECVGEAGAIHQQVENAFAHIYQPSTIRWACRRLVKQGLIANTGRINYTVSCCKAVVWAVVQSKTPGWQGS